MNRLLKYLDVVRLVWIRHFFVFVQQFFFQACLTKATAALQCSCVQALADPAATCLDFKTLNTAVKAQKDSCTKVKR